MSAGMADAPSLGQPHWEGTSQWVKPEVRSEGLLMAQGGAGAVSTEQPGGQRLLLGLMWIWVEKRQSKNRAFEKISLVEPNNFY